MTRNVELINIARIDLLKGYINTELDLLTTILLDNYNKKIDSNSDSTRFEDSFCPSNPYLDEIITQIKTDFYVATQEKIKESNYWGHIHEKNMSTNLHNHNTSYVSAVVYLKLPEGSGDIVFRPRYNQYDNVAYSSTFKPEEGTYFIFPGYLDHFVTRNQSEEKRVSLSINFEKQ